MTKASPSPVANALYYGDNLEVLRQHFADATVDLVYLDPPFNSAVDYNVLFREHDGTQAAAQIKAFKDTWQWDQTAARAFDDFVVDPEVPHKPKETLLAFRQLLGPTDMLAYLAMMAPRLVELHRVLKPTGSLYLHCDPTASHYLKLLLDGVFGPQAFCNELIWKRTSAHSSSQRYGPVHDSIFFYAKSDQKVWNPQYSTYSDEYLATFFDHVDPDGRRWKRMDLTGAGTRQGETGKPWRGIDVTAKGRHWAYLPKELDQFDAAGKIHWPKKEGGMPRLKQYADEMSGVLLQDVWTDVPPLHNLAAERLGYPTQKPVALLERIITASSHPGGLVLDPFCGCGTTVAAAQKLGRRWVGIDITSLAVTLIKNRLRGEYGPGIAKKYRVVGEPTTVDDALTLAGENPYQFQWWALGLVGARPVEEKKGADKGIDGRLYFTADKGAAKQVVFSVKAGANVSVAAVRDLIGVVQREQAAIVVVVTMHEPTKPMLAEAAGAGFYDVGAPTYSRHPAVQILTVAELLAGKQVDMPLVQTNRTFKQAVRVKGSGRKDGHPSLPMSDG